MWYLCIGFDSSRIRRFEDGRVASRSTTWPAYSLLGDLENLPPAATQETRQTRCTSSTSVLLTALESFDHRYRHPRPALSLGQQLTW